MKSFVRTYNSSTSVRGVKNITNNIVTYITVLSNLDILSSNQYPIVLIGLSQRKLPTNNITADVMCKIDNKIDKIDKTDGFIIHIFNGQTNIFFLL